jgi:hypothetical protein
VCWKEASFQLADCAAVAYVLQARALRAGWSLERMAWSYASLGADNPRAAMARALPDGDASFLTQAENGRWGQVRVVSREALAGAIANPCPGARHWGGLKLGPDARRAAAAVQGGRWRQVRCVRKTLNTFFAEGRATVAAVQAAGGYR